MRVRRTRTTVAPSEWKAYHGKTINGVVLALPRVEVVVVVVILVVVVAVAVLIVVEEREERSSRAVFDVDVDVDVDAVGRRHLFYTFLLLLVLWHCTYCRSCSS